MSLHETTPSPAPRADAPAEHAASVRDPVLVVDDNPTVAGALGGLLSRAGYRPVICHSGAAALDYAHRHPLAGAVVDIHLPDISGLIVTQGLRDRLGPEKPIIAVSGDTSMENLHALPHAGVTWFISKPVRASQFLDQIRELLP